MTKLTFCVLDLHDDGSTLESFIIFDPCQRSVNTKIQRKTYNWLDMTGF